MASIDTSPPLRFRGRAGTERTARLPVWLPDTLEVIHGASQFEEIERFRYSIYVAEQDKPLPAADHLARRLPDEDDHSAFHFCVRDSSRQLVGYARMHYAEAIPAATVSRLALGDLLQDSPRVLGFISKLMVNRSLRGRTNAVRLIMSMIQYGCERFKDAEGAVFHCSSELVSLYTRMGFRPFGTPFIDPHVGLQTPMVAIFRDLEHFQECGSPIASIAESLPQPDAKLERFRDYFLATRAFHAASPVHALAPSVFRTPRAVPPPGELMARVKLA